MGANPTTTGFFLMGFSGSRAPARPGVTYLSLIHKALAAHDREGALAAIEDAR